MFDISRNISINLEIFHNSKIYIIDNFYNDPDSVLDYFLGIVPPLWKTGYTEEEDSKKISYNGVYFDDRRHLLQSDEIAKVYDLLTLLCGEQACGNKDVVTNVTRFKDCEFNNYENNYWWPHFDEGYTGILYFNNDDEVSGTNLYECLEENYVPKLEHECPWVSKKKFKLIKTLYPKYNRMVLFDAKKFRHGMNICNDNYFGDNYRMNQVFFMRGS